MIARQLDENRVVVRTSFESRGFPAPIVPGDVLGAQTLRQHMMIVADLEKGNADAVEDAVIGAWELRSAK